MKRQSNSSPMVVNGLQDKCMSSQRGSMQRDALDRVLEIRGEVNIYPIPNLGAIFN